MDFEKKARLAALGHYDKASAARRLRAARQSIGYTTRDVAAALRRTQPGITSAENAKILPSWTLMMWFFKNHRIDINFFVGGSFSQLRRTSRRLFSLS